MNTSIRKDSKVSAHTSNNVLVLGVVQGVNGDKLLIETTAGTPIEVLKVSATKLSAADFKTMVAEASQPKAEVKAVKAEIKAEIKKQVKKEVAKINKKVLALEIFAKHKGAKRKIVIAEFKLNGMSAACASTYFQNIKSGAWS